MERPEKPRELKTPGMMWVKRAFYWQPRSEIAKRGCPIKGQRLWPSSGAVYPICPAPDEWIEISARCCLLQSEMLKWAGGGFPDDARSVYDGTIRSLSRVYQTNPASSFHELRYRSQMIRSGYLTVIERSIGDAAVKSLTFVDFKRWNDRFREPAVEGGRDRVAQTSMLMFLVRHIIAFGAALELTGCARIHQIVAGARAGGTGALRVEGAKKRKVFLTAEQATLVRQEAHRRGQHSIALLQALTFELGARAGDFIGQWLPDSEPGVSDVLWEGRKWCFGARWNDISPDGVLTLRISKSIRGRRASGQADTGNFEQFNLNSYPMVMEELSREAGVVQGSTAIPRTARPTLGPLIINEATGRPWNSQHFAHAWRKIARAVGIPDHVQHRDSRAGAITEGRKSGARLEDMRIVAGHAQISMTARYDRTDMETRDKVAQLRAEKRK